MKFRLRRFGRPLFESALIVFSVLLALFVNRWAEDQRIEERKEVALERIAEELRDNQKLVQNVLRIHQSAVVNLQKAVTNDRDSLRSYLAGRRYFDSEIFTLLVDGGSFYPRAPSSTSWEAAKSTGIIAEFDYGIVDILTGTYSIQEISLTSTLPLITQAFFRPIADNELDTINALLARINELISQEETLLWYINEALDRIEDKRSEH